MRWLLMTGLAVGTTLCCLAAPPGGARVGGGTGRFGGGSITGPAPIGASGPAPIGGTGNLLRVPVPGPRVGGFRGGTFVNPGGTYVNPGGTYVNSGTHGNRSPYGNTRRSERNRAPYAFFLTPYAYPYLGYDDASYVGFDYGMSGAYALPGPMDRAAQDLAAGQDALGRQVEQLTSEIEQLRAQQQPSQQSLDAPAPAAPENSQPVVPLTVVLTDGQQLQVASYAVMNGIFWDFSKQPARKIPLSAINVDASVKATQGAGGEFPDLSSR